MNEIAEGRTNMICFDISALDCNLLAGLTELAPVYDFVWKKEKESC